MLAGGIAGAIEAGATWPVEYIKTQQQQPRKIVVRGGIVSAPQPYKGIVEGLQYNIKTAGFFSVYTGLTPTLILSIPKSSCRFGANAYFRDQLRSADGTLSAGASFVAGLFAGIAEAVLVVTPQETIKTKLISLNMGFRSGVRLIVEREGVAGLYQGGLSTALKQGGSVPSSAANARPGALPPAIRPSTVDGSHGSRGPKVLAILEAVLSVEEGGAPHGAPPSPLKRQSTLGVSELKKRKAEQAKKKLAPVPALISRDQTAREAHHSRDHSRNGGSRPPSAANGTLSNGGSRPASARGAVTSRPASSSPTINFLSKILSNKEGNGQKDVLPATVPTWKEDLVDNVRRRAAAHQAVKDYEAKCAAEKLAAEALEKEKQEMARLEAMTTADSLAAAGKATSRAASARGQRDAESPRPLSSKHELHAPSTSEPAPPSAGNSRQSSRPASARSHAASASATPADADAAEDEMGVENNMTAELAAMIARHDRNVREKQALISHYSNEYDKQVLQKQFNDADHEKMKRLLKSNIAELVRQGGRAGLQAAGSAADQALLITHDKMCVKVELLEARASESININTALEGAINKYRAERQDQKRFLLETDAREKQMDKDMRAFRAAAHSALDDKERVRGRLRRMRHEWKSETASAESDLQSLRTMEDELDKVIAIGEAAEEKDLQAFKRAESHQMRVAYAYTQKISLKAGYIRAQLEGNARQLLHLGQCAGVSGQNASATEAERYEVSDPNSCKEILLRTHKANETRNASELAFYQEQADLVEEAIRELTELEVEEEILTKRSKAATAANWSKGKHLLDQVATADREARRQEQLLSQLASVAPQLESCLARLHEAFATLGTAPNGLRPPLPARYVPKGLEAPRDKQPSHVQVSVSMEQLDALLQTLQSRVTHLVTMRGVDEETGEPIPLHEHLRPFVEIPEARSFAETKAEHDEMVLALFKRREAEEKDA
ncbi:tricarboxylate transport mitochondrial [Chrysochromulina tobinii]|uniref:Tricarboxylate transport mitochondrial n=1 Tax=Chrysochromulina tobinii TaxID=1460289 RepID=A0A0M0JTU2_9EUKA|nr:tricarboxylate transport mitochondrial [Chrysochromulina tobinii]|eukprot:KOO29772.1 tricarboxylate transport mitochondrial [Chrysochromulina sp. CCMP291]